MGKTLAFSEHSVVAGKYVSFLTFCKLHDNDVNKCLELLRDEGIPMYNFKKIVEERLAFSQLTTNSARGPFVRLSEGQSCFRLIIASIVNDRIRHIFQK